MKLQTARFWRTPIYATLATAIGIVLIVIASAFDCGISVRNYWTMVDMQYTLAYAYAGILFGVAFSVLRNRKCFWLAMPLILLAVNLFYGEFVDDMQKWSWLDRWIFEDPDFNRTLIILK